MNFGQLFTGVANITIPIIGVLYFFPYLLGSTVGIMTVAVIFGIYIWYLNFIQHRRVINSLLYVPTGTHKQMFEDIIRSCGLAASAVNLKYAYTDEKIAMALSNTIVIDPTICSMCEDDLGSDPVKNVYHQMFAPTFTSLKVQRLIKYKAILSPEVQCFIFKHELGHVVDHYSVKKLFIIFAIGTAAVYAGLLMAKILLGIHVVLAILGGMLVGGVVDIMLTYLFNVMFTLAAEKKADRFAAQHSTAEQIKAAALFFEQHQEILDRHKEVDGFWARIPSEILTGHPRGQARSAYLLKLAAQKQQY